jgi:putative FmdB family regulatory protein
MPTYEYRCNKCEDNFEVVQKITEDPVAECSKCGGKVERLINATNFILKGNGWYKTDYASAGSSASSSSESPSSSESSSCSAEKSKPACSGCPANSD